MKLYTKFHGNREEEAINSSVSGSRELGLKGQRGEVILEDKIAKKKKKRKEGTFSRDSEDCHIATAESGAKGKKKEKEQQKTKLEKKRK